MVRDGRQHRVQNRMIISGKRARIAVSLFDVSGGW